MTLSTMKSWKNIKSTYHQHINDNFLPFYHFLDNTILHLPFAFHWLKYKWPLLTSNDLRLFSNHSQPKWSKVTFKHSCISLMTSWYSDFFVILTEAPSKNVSFWNEIVFVTFCDSELNSQKRCPELLSNWHLNSGLWKFLLRVDRTSWTSTSHPTTFDLLT